MTDMPVQLVVSDLDGTLLDSACYLSAGAEQAIAALNARGIGFTIASGRGYSLMMPLVRRLKLSLPAIFSGGAIILAPGGAPVELAHPVPLADALALREYARAHGLGVTFHEADGVFAEANDAVWERGAQHNWLPEEPGPIHPFHYLDDLMAGRDRPPVRVDLFGPEAAVRAAVAEVPALFPTLQLMHIVGHLEITVGGVNKGSAVVRLAQILGIPIEAVLVIGDDINDLSMFAMAGQAVAMGNAIPTLKALAKAIAPTNDEGGFAWAMRHVVLNHSHDA